MIDKSRAKGLAVCFFVLFLAAAYVFSYLDLAIDDAVRYRPLANGWVSIYPEIHLDEHLSVVEKIEKIVKEDLVHGRFRPAFFTYISIPYFLSPVVYDNEATEEARPYLDLLNGDLRITGFFLLLSVVVSMALLMLSVYRFCNTILFSLLPVFFVPLSPSLAENLLQNFIDSQEIPLVLLASLWLFSLFSSFKYENSTVKKYLYFSISLLALFVSFLVKETSVIIACALCLLVLLELLFFRFGKEYAWPTKAVVVQSALSVVLAIGVVGFVAVNSRGYASSYNVSCLGLVSVFGQLWVLVSKYSLVNVFSFVFVAVFFVLAGMLRGQKVNDIIVENHIRFALLLLFLSVGFLVVLFPWKPVLVKYVYPSVFFFSFLVSYAVSFVFSVLKERYGGKSYLFFGIVVMSYMFLYCGYYGESVKEKQYLFSVSNYGVTALYDVADDIDEEFGDVDGEDVYIYVGYDDSQRWEISVPWSVLHLKRILNFDKFFNIIDVERGAVLNYKMPLGELTSFSRYNGHGNVFVTDDKKLIDEKVFDVLYIAHLDGVEPLPELSFKSKKYYLLEEKVIYNTDLNKKSFVFYKYM
ncbi:hypothetical protein [Desulfogranum mediterraneum]|uniref:hypothetical protein n=1 Tax=Desulfogranum mediterraneum TaxID=160661 RepID=UPI0003FD0362|nr:hypothetical protein [Desulfogranum mediterraneum]